MLRRHVGVECHPPGLHWERTLWEWRPSDELLLFSLCKCLHKRCEVKFSFMRNRDQLWGVPALRESTVSRWKL